MHIARFQSVQSSSEQPLLVHISEFISIQKQGIDPIEVKFLCPSTLFGPCSQIIGYFTADLA